MGNTNGQYSRLMATYHDRASKTTSIIWMFVLEMPYNYIIAKHQVAAVAFDVSKTIDWIQPYISWNSELKWKNNTWVT